MALSFCSFRHPSSSVTHELCERGRPSISGGKRDGSRHDMKACRGNNNELLTFNIMATAHVSTLQV